jgi:hypothetical protein
MEAEDFALVLSYNIGNRRLYFFSDYINETIMKVKPQQRSCHPRIICHSRPNTGSNNFCEVRTCVVIEFIIKLA